jgi:hypothetical protein
MEKLIGSGYDKIKGRPYFDTRARYGREPDTIVFWYAITPKGKMSKYWATLRINSERNVGTDRKLRYIQEYQFPVLRKGYSWSNPLLYSGEI